MITPKRYTASVMHVGVREDPEGALIAYQHYEMLKADYERLLIYCYSLEKEIDEGKKS
jgi:hypothetical protein